MRKYHTVNVLLKDDKGKKRSNEIEYDDETCIDNSFGELYTKLQFDSSLFHTSTAPRSPDISDTVLT